MVLKEEEIEGGQGRLNICDAFSLVNSTASAITNRTGRGCSIMQLLIGVSDGRTRRLAGIGSWALSLTTGCFPAVLLAFHLIESELVVTIVVFFKIIYIVSGYICHVQIVKYMSSSTTAKLPYTKSKGTQIRTRSNETSINPCTKLIPV